MFCSRQLTAGQNHYFRIFAMRCKFSSRFGNIDDILMLYVVVVF